MEKERAVTPFLKWAGGKQWLVPTLQPLLSGPGRYIEPFLGGGSVFFALRPRSRALLTDRNRDLIQTYQAIKDNVSGVISALNRFSYTERCFTTVRNSEPKTEVESAARLIFLNRTCWNGLYRVNLQGKFNVPMGQFSNPDFKVTDRLIAASEALAHATLRCADFATTCATAKRGDVVYLDPPYTVTHGQNGFVRYNEKIFSWKDQQRLAMLATELSQRGCKVIVSNADHFSLRRLYSDFRTQVISRKSLIAAEAGKRRPVTELLLTNF